MEHVALAPAGAGAVTLSTPVETSVTVEPKPHKEPSPNAGIRAFERIASHWRVIALVAAAATLVAWLFAALQPKRYRASAIVAVTPTVDGLGATDVMRGVDTLERRTLVATIAALATTPLTRTQAMGANPDDSYSIDAAVLPNTNLLRVSVEGEDAQRTAAIANRVATVLGPQTRAMYRFYRVTTVSAATTPSDAIFPRVGRAVLAGLLLGAILGALVAWTIDTRRPLLTR